MCDAMSLAVEVDGEVVCGGAVCGVWIRLLEGLRQRQLAAGLVGGLKVVGSGTLLSGLMLALAGLYEATTLILLM